MILTEFCQKVKKSSDFSLIKYIVAPLSSSGLSIKLIDWIKSGFSTAMCLVKPIAISL